MVFSSIRNRLAALLLGSALLVPAMAQTVLALPSAQKPGADLRQALSIAPGEALRLERLPLGESGGELVSAELRRTDAGASAALLVVHSGSEVTQTRPAPRAHFTGQLVGDPSSSVFVSIDSDGAMRSIVRRGGDTFVSDMPAANAFSSSAFGASGSSSALHSRRVDSVVDAPEQPFSCEVDSHFIEKNYIVPSVELLQSLQRNNTRAALKITAASSSKRRADIIIETDYELYQRLGSKEAVSAYVIDLLGYASSQYESEIGARLNVTQINVYTSPSDPWSGANAEALLAELRAYWNAPIRSSQARHHVHLLSGRDSGTGIAYVGTLDSSARSHAYGVSAGIKANFTANNPQIIWDSIVVAHEIGHAFGSSHTHSYDNPYAGSSEGGAIDCCVSEDGGMQCTSKLGGTDRIGVLPGINSIDGGILGTGAGTIMSYCHFITGNMTNLSFNFGTNHTRGVNPWRVANVLQSSAQTYLPLDNVVQNYALSVSRQGTGSGTVSSTPAGIDCGSSCTANFAAGTQVALAAKPASGSSFAGWSGACSGSTSSCTVNMNSSLSVTANFNVAAATRLITLSKSGAGVGNVTSSPSGLSCLADCGVASASFASNAAITLTAQAAAGSEFTGWSGACSGTGSNCIIPVGTSSASVNANFNVASTTTRTFSVAKAGAGKGTITISPYGWTCEPTCTKISGTIPNSAAITLTAQAATGSVFAGWSGACSGTSSSCTLAAGTSALDITAIFNNSSGGGGTLTDPMLFVTQQYYDLFNRSPDSIGLNHWVLQLQSGAVSRGQLIEVFMEQPEFRERYGPLVRLYTAYFRRIPDYIGLMYWYGQMYPSNGSEGIFLSNVSDVFSQSPEFIKTYGHLSNLQFIELVYNNVLGRAAEPAGRDAWLLRLNSGMSRGEMMIGFSESIENLNGSRHATNITMAYAGMLRRVPSATEHATRLADLRAGRETMLSMIDTILKSDEYARRFP